MTNQTDVKQLLTDNLDIWLSAETEKKSGRGRASGSKSTVYGIQKLRELILELAVRGKLVPQDSSDEPASDLLKRIQAEKAKLVADGKLKKEKPLAPIGENEKPFELPKGWEWIHLPDVTDYKVGKTPSTKSSIYWTNDNNGYNWVSIADLNHDGVVTETSKKVTQEALKEVFRAEPVAVGTILMSFKLTLGKISILEVPAFHNEAIISIYPSQAIDKRYLFKILPARANEGESKSAIKGNTLNSESIAALLLPLPPLAEQHRIVAKVDELMALCDQLEQQHSNAQQAHETLVNILLGTLTQSQNANEFQSNWQRIAAHFETLFTTQASIEALKQTLLQLAVMGKLVPQDPNDEPASELLKRIQAEKAKLIAEGKVKKEKPLAQISENEKPFELPQGWEWTNLLIAAAINPRNNAPDDTQASFVPMTLIGSAFNDKHQEEKRLWKDIKQGFTHFAEGDIGVAKITPCFENSKACVFENLESGLGAGTTELHIVRPVKNTLNPRYVLAYLKSPRFLELGESKMTGTAGQKRLPKDFVESNPFPLPPIAEQNRIVAKVDALMALCDQLSARIQQTSQQQQLIANALVAQAVE